MNDLRQAAQQALDALVSQFDGRADAMNILSAALAQQAEPQDAELSAALGWPGGISNPVLDRKVLLQKVAALAQQAEPVEPVAWALHTGTKQGIKWNRRVEHGTPLYTAPPHRMPLTEEEIDAVWDQWFGAYGLRGSDGPYTRRGFARAIEEAHGITDPQVADRLARHGIPMLGDPK